MIQDCEIESLFLVLFIKKKEDYTAILNANLLVNKH